VRLSVDYDMRLLRDEKEGGDRTEGREDARRTFHLHAIDRGDGREVFL
jgi:hypothetical protein